MEIGKEASRMENADHKDFTLAWIEIQDIFGFLGHVPTGFRKIRLRIEPVIRFFIPNKRKFGVVLKGFRFFCGIFGGLGLLHWQLMFY